MYKSLHIQNFRCFRNIELDDLSRVNLIAGLNNTGKTALLEAILTHTGEYDASRLLRAPATRFYRTRTRLSEPLESSRRESNIPSWYILFHNFNVEIPVLLSGVFERSQDQPHLWGENETEKKLEVSIGNTIELPDDSWILRYLGGEVDFLRMLSSEMEILKFTTGGEKPFHLAQFMGSIISDRRAGRARTTEFPATFLPSSEQVSLEDDAARFTDLKRARQEEWLLKALQTLEPRLQGLELFYDGDPPVIHGDLEGLPQPIPISSMGEGMRRLTSLLLAISMTRNGVVFIDEIENGLHYGVQGGVWIAVAEAAREYNVQIFATTHSYEMISAAHKAFIMDEPYDFRLHRLHRSTKTGEITPTTFNRFTMSAALDAEAEVR